MNAIKRLSPSFLISTLFLILPLAICAQDDMAKSEWRSKELKIDGSQKDWNLPFRYYDKATGMRFEISNNNSHLFLFLMTNDPMKINKLIISGMQIQLSSKEKGKKFSTAINIPGVQFENEGFQKDLKEKPTGNEFFIVISKYKLQLPGIRTKGFKTKNGDLPLIDNNGISIGIAADSIKNLCYEISVPLKELIPENLVKLNEILQLNIKINAYVAPGEDKRKKEEAISSNRTYAGMYGYVYNPTIMYGGSGFQDVPDIFKENICKLKFRLTGN